MKQEGEVNTDLYCHNCQKTFVAAIDFRIDGNHEIHCAYCDHIHFRVIKDGVATEDRFSSDDSDKPSTIARKTWKAEGLGITTSTASHFLRERWLERLL